jgi:hypothetical protein
VDPGDLPDDVRESKWFGVEVDAMPGGFVCSGSFKGELKAGHVKEAIAGERPLGSSTPRSSERSGRSTPLTALIWMTCRSSAP